jgi:hypothetical protein
MAHTFKGYSGAILYVGGRPQTICPRVIEQSFLGPLRWLLEDTVDQSKRSETSEMSEMQGLSQQAYMTSTLSMVMQSALCL